MNTSEIQIIGIHGIPQVHRGDDVSSVIVNAMQESGLRPAALDIFVIAQKIVSKAEGRIIHLDSVVPSQFARTWAAAYEKDARMVEVVLRESARIVRMERGILISETRHGFICANAGVDASNVEPETVTLLPEHPDRSAREIKESIEHHLGASVAVIISDSFGRPWREGLVNVALGVAGMDPIVDLRGTLDWCGQPLRVTTIAVADEVASAAELVMGKNSGTPAALVRGFKYQPTASNASGLIRRSELDLFR